MNSIKYSTVNINKNGLKYTMDGGADGHDFNSSNDEILHNIIDMLSDNVVINISDYIISFRFNINKDIGDPVERLKNGVGLYETQGNVVDKDISKYGKGIKCASHCIFEKGKMILILHINGELNMSVYNQGDMTSILPNSESSEVLKDIYKQKLSIDLQEDYGILILVDESSDDYDKIFDKFNSEEIIQDNNIIKNLMKHISICYYPYLDKNFECENTKYHNMNIILNQQVIPPFSHTCYSSEKLDDNEEIEYFAKYECYVPYRIIDGKIKPDFRLIRFKCIKNQLISFGEDGSKQSPEDLELEGIPEEQQLKCIIRLTKLSDTSQSRYNSEYSDYEKTKSCSYFMYRNGVCSGSSFIPFEGKNGFRPTDCPQLRGEIHFDNQFDYVVNPGSNKSIVRPNIEFSNAVRSLAKYVQKNVFKKVEKDRKVKIEGKNYIVTPKNEILNNDGKPIGKLAKNGNPSWDKLKLKKKEKEEIINNNNNSTPLLKQEVPDVKSIGTKPGSELRLYTTNPENLDDKGDITVLSNEEYSMITSGNIEPKLFESSNKLNLENKTKEIFNEKLKDILEKVKKNNYKLVDESGKELNIENIKIV